ncbi:MAG: nucleoside hydrolase [Anaerolineae bacterium]
MALLHLDTDLGGDSDDLCALAYLLAHADVELTGVTTCCENGGRRAGYVRYALRLAGREDVPVAAGAEGSLGGWRDPCSPEGPGLPDEAENWPEPVDACPSTAGEALALLEQSVRRGATIVGIGTFTNLALLEASRPGLLADAKLVLMGGYVRPPRPGLPAWGPEMDWNVQQDVTAARLLYDRCHPVVVPDDMTMETYIREADLPALGQAGPLGALLARQAVAHGAECDAEAMRSANPALPAGFLNFQHDPLACAVALGWEGATVETMRLLVDTQDGWLVLRPDPDGREMQVVTAVDGEGFARHWLQTVTAGARRQGWA